MSSLPRFYFIGVLASYGCRFVSPIITGALSGAFFAVILAIGGSPDLAFLEVEDNAGLFWAVLPMLGLDTLLGIVLSLTALSKLAKHFRVAEETTA